MDMCEGQPPKSLVFRHNSELVSVSESLCNFCTYILIYNTLIQNGDFKCLGILVGMSFLNGGSGYPFFAPSLYHYVCGKDVCNITPLIDEVPDHDLRTVLLKQHHSTD